MLIGGYNQAHYTWAMKNVEKVNSGRPLEQATNELVMTEGEGGAAKETVMSQTGPQPKPDQDTMGYRQTQGLLCSRLHGESVLEVPKMKDKNSVDNEKKGIKQ